MAEVTITRSTNETLRNDMWHACDILRRDNNVGGVMQYTEHLAWLLFLKFLDEEEKRRADLSLLSNEPYRPALTGQLAWNFWASPAALEQRTADALIQFVRGRLLPSLATLTGSPLAVTIAKIFSDESIDDQNVVRAIPVCASGYNLKEVLAIINRIRFDQESDLFTISLFYEDLLERMSGENRTSGEFHTPRAVIKFLVHVIAPQIGETVYDPAVGSAGFLVQAFSFMQPFAKTVDQDRVLQEATFTGIEKKALSALLGTMNMVLHGVHSPQIIRANTLEESVKGDVSQRYDIVLTNPPFGGTEGSHIQQNFTVKANATELLFLQHIIKKLKKTSNARAAIVVPEGTLFRAGAFAEVKRDLFEQFHLFMVVSLPPGTFAPYSDVKTALLFFKRPGDVMQQQPLARNEVLFYELPLPTGLKKFSKGSRIVEEHFVEARGVWQRWEEYLQGKRERPFADAATVRANWLAYQNKVGPQPQPPYNVWVERIEDIVARSYDLSAHNPNQNEAERLPAPTELTARLLERSRELHTMIESLHAKLTNREFEA